MNVAPRVSQYARLAVPAAVIAGLISSIGATEAAADQTTVQSLLDQGYAVAGVVHSERAGGGVYLVKGNSLMFCDVQETPASTIVATQYCKPVK